ncbi:MAG: hypothetical protein WKF77_23040 [Planctomycetaceae bacterium]
MGAEEDRVAAEAAEARVAVNSSEAQEESRDATEAAEAALVATEAAEAAEEARVAADIAEAAEKARVADQVEEEAGSLRKPLRLLRNKFQVRRSYRVPVPLRKPQIKPVPSPRQLQVSPPNLRPAIDSRGIATCVVLLAKL